ncbi:MAG: HD domain-containing phosphohydrolase [Thermotaleaceae bacterium]
MKLTNKYVFYAVLSIFITGVFNILVIALPLNAYETYSIDETIDEKKRIIEVYTGRRLQDLENKAVEYAYWDDALKAMSPWNENWLKENISKYLYESPYNIDFVFLYNFEQMRSQFFSDGVSLHQINFSPPTALEPIIMPKTFLRLVGKELYAFTMAPLTNNDGSLPPVGYLLLGQKLDATYLMPLMDYLGSSQQIYMVYDEHKEDHYHPIDNKYVNFIYNFYDEHNQYLASYEILLDVSSIRQLKLNLFKAISFLILCSLLIGSLLMGFLSKQLTTRLNGVIDSIKSIAAGNYSHKLPIAGEDEIKYLSTSVNTLSDNILSNISELHNSYFQTIEAFVTTIEVKDFYTKGHSERVANLSVCIAEVLKLPSFEEILTAALIHDIGKIGIPEAILNKPGRLTEEEYSQIKAHPEIGYRILNNIEGFNNIKDIIRHHHEWYNGKGYPLGLTRDEIPLGARIISVADAFDAMTSNRPYKTSHSTEEAMIEIHRMSGIQFDPLVVDAFDHVINTLFYDSPLEQNENLIHK